MYFFMHIASVWRTERLTRCLQSLNPLQIQVRRNRMGMWLFFVSEAFLFGGLLISRFFLWGQHPAGIAAGRRWPSPAPCC